MARAHLFHRLERPAFARKRRAVGFSVAGAVAFAAAIAPVAQAGVDAQHNETLVVV